VIVAGFFDAGINRISRPSQLTLRPERVAELNAIFPQAGFDGRALIAPATQNMRSSTGVELQVMMPVVNAPFRLYWAYNPQIVRTFLQPPVVVDRSYFPNQETFLRSVALWGQASPFYERRTTFRFSIGRTF
jgi:outer membrane protein insertion porin family